jgi:two-component system, cell cycle sensor histidine kinase and response regulator CckA
VMSYSLTNTYIQAQKKLKKTIESLKELAAAVDQAAESIIITDKQGIITYVNPHCENMTGYSKSELIGKSPKIFQSGKHPAQFYSNLWETLKKGGTWRGQFTNKKKDGTYFEEKAVISPVYDENKELIAFVNVKRDVTNEILLENQARQSQKMAAIGQFAHKVAHDVTNKLVIILGSIQHIKDNVKDSPALVTMVDNVIDASNRISSLTADLMAFAHPAKLAPKTVIFDKIISSLEDILQRTLGKDVIMEFHLNAPCLKVKVDPVQIEQALVHLALNSVESMPQGGRLTVETNRADLTTEETKELQATTHEKDRHKGDFVILTVTDTGEGMTQEQLTHIFEPFFTTRKDKQNIGLGLTTVYRIIQMHEGYIQVNSEPGKGTQFNIYLPIIEG